MPITRTITIGDAHATELRDVFSEDYQAQIFDVDGVTLIPNPETQSQYASRKFNEGARQWLMSRVMSYRKRQAAIDQTDITEDNV